MPHLDEPRLFISDNKPHITGITETKIDSTIQNSDIEIDDYVIERNDRDKHCGGIALRIRKSINLGKIYKIPMWNQSLSK